MEQTNHLIIVSCRPSEMCACEGCVTRTYNDNGLVGVWQKPVCSLAVGLAGWTGLCPHMWGHQRHEQKAESLSCEHPLFLVFSQERIELCVWDLVGKVSLGMWLRKGRGEGWQEGPVFLSSWGYGIIWGVRGQAALSPTRTHSLKHTKPTADTTHTVPSDWALGHREALSSPLVLPHKCPIQGISQYRQQILSGLISHLRMTNLPAEKPWDSPIRLMEQKCYLMSNLQSKNKKKSTLAFLLCFNKGCPEQSRR